VGPPYSAVDERLVGRGAGSTTTGSDTDTDTDRGVSLTHETDKEGFAPAALFRRSGALHRAHPLSAGLSRAGTAPQPGSHQPM